MYSVVDGNSAAHSGSELEAEWRAFFQEMLLHCLHQQATREWISYAIVEHAKQEMYSHSLNSLISIGVVIVTNTNDNDDDVHLVGYVMNLILCINFNYHFGELVREQ